jgi:YggT family protein
VNDSIALVFIVFLYILIFAIIGRALLSWFPANVQDNQFARLLHQVTEPLLAPVRQVMPRMGMFDFSAFVVIIVLYIMIAVVQRAADA